MRDNARRLRTLVLLLRYTGLRIGVAVSCSLERFAEGRVRLYTQKTGTHVHCPVPDFVTKELDALAKKSDRHWFWTGSCKLKTAVTDWQARLRTLFEDAKVASGHAHRFRDTFAVELFLDGVPLERVSILLGHTSIRVTEKHYSPWVRERQEQAEAEADIRGAWAKDPVVLLETKGTLEVHGTPEPVNQKKTKHKEWRRGWDSNPRDPFGPNGFQDRRSQPLSYPSVFGCLLHPNLRRI